MYKARTSGLVTVIILFALVYIDSLIDLVHLVDYKVVAVRDTSTCRTQEMYTNYQLYLL